MEHKKEFMEETKARRNCCEVISQMLEKVPASETSLREDLEWNKEDASFKAPEEDIQWIRTSLTLRKHIGKPTEEWHFEVLSIFTTLSIEDLKSSV